MTTDTLPIDAAELRWHRWWRWLWIGLCVLILCSCRSGTRPCQQPSSPQAYPSLPPEAYTGAPPLGDCPPAPPLGPPGMELGVPVPYEPMGPWAPPGIARPWPFDEYLRDGGDAGVPAGVTRQWEVQGLEVEDTIAHYDTVDGRTLVEPSNRVHIYSPRFGAVRQVVSPVASEQHDRATAVQMPLKPVRHDDTRPVLSSKQQWQAIGQLAARPPVVLQTRQGDGVMSQAIGPRGFYDGFKAYENLAIIRRGMFEMAEMPLLAQGIDAAVAWTHNQAVQVALDHQAATAAVSNRNVELLYTIKGHGEPKLRIVKVASTPFAEPGDEVYFTLRFDNVGTQVIGNVTIIDNLSTRLEYLPNSAQCSRQAQFSTQPNEGDSLVLRWEIADPLKPGEGGIVRFSCRVR